MKIYVALSTFAQEGKQPLELLEKSGFFFQINPYGRRLTKQEVVDNLQDADGVIAGLESYEASVLNDLPKLKCISRCGVGIDNIDLEIAKGKGITILNTAEVVVQPVAEMTLAMIFDLLRKITLHARSMSQRKWERFTGSQIAGKTIGIIGLGRIGKRVAELLKGLSVKVLAYDLIPDHQWARKENIFFVEKEQLLKQSDVITLHLTSKEICLGFKEFNMMKKGSMLVNTARGCLIDEIALIEALKTSRIAGAALDAYQEEPYQGPLCDLPNVILTPHIATLTQESRVDMEIEAVQQIINFLNNQNKG